MRYFHLILLFSLNLLAGCFGGGEVVPQDQFYHLADLSAEVAQVSKPLGVVAVSPLQSDVLHHERDILYSEQSAPLKLNTYYYHHWSDAPFHTTMDRPNFQRVEGENVSGVATNVNHRNPAFSHLQVNKAGSIYRQDKIAEAAKGFRDYIVGDNAEVQGGG